MKFIKAFSKLKATPLLQKPRIAMYRTGWRQDSSLRVYIVSRQNNPTIKCCIECSDFRCHVFPYKFSDEDLFADDWIIQKYGETKT